MKMRKKTLINFLNEQQYVSPAWYKAKKTLIKSKGKIFSDKFEVSMPKDIYPISPLSFEIDFYIYGFYVFDKNKNVLNNETNQIEKNPFYEKVILYIATSSKEINDYLFFYKTLSKLKTVGFRAADKIFGEEMDYKIFIRNYGYPSNYSSIDYTEKIRKQSRIPEVEEYLKKALQIALANFFSYPSKELKDFKILKSIVEKSSFIEKIINASTKIIQGNIKFVTKEEEPLSFIDLKTLGDEFSFFSEREIKNFIKDIMKNKKVREIIKQEIKKYS